jgi:thiamine biosynthesis lipoprotein
LTHASLATSGPAMQFVEIDGVRYSHVIDPRAGLGLTNRVTARVIASDGATADALATALTVLEPKDARRLQSKFPGVLISIER